MGLKKKQTLIQDSSKFFSLGILKVRGYPTTEARNPEQRPEQKGFNLNTFQRFHSFAIFIQ